MHAQNCLFLALECSNQVHSDLDKLMEALFFISCQLPGLGAAGRCTATCASFGTLTCRRCGRLVKAHLAQNFEKIVEISLQ